MVNRTSGFLHPGERTYLEEEGIYRYPGSFEGIESGGRRAKSRIQNEVVTVPQLQMLLLGFMNDLEAVQSLQRTDVATWKAWESGTLPAVTQELEWLRDTVDQMLEIAERDRFKEEAEEMRTAVEPLYPGDYHPREAYGTGVMGDEPPEAVQQWTAEELADRFETVEIRREGLRTLCNVDELAEILSYIASEPPRELPSRQIGDDGEWWSKAASDYLAPELVTKTEHSQTRREYEITEHGTAVLECWNRLLDTTAVEMEADARPEADERVHINRALELHDPLLGI